MKEDFVTWAMFMDYSMFVTIVFAWVAFTKNWKFIKKIPTRLYSFIIAFIFMIIVQLHGGTFLAWDLFLYASTALFVSLTTNGLSLANEKKPKVEEK